jgi:hypothetical protein
MPWKSPGVALSRIDFYISEIILRCAQSGLAAIKDGDNMGAVHPSQANARKKARFFARLSLKATVLSLLGMTISSIYVTEDKSSVR